MLITCNELKSFRRKCRLINEINGIAVNKKQTILLFHVILWFEYISFTDLFLGTSM